MKTLFTIMSVLLVIISTASGRTGILTVPHKVDVTKRVLKVGDLGQYAFDFGPVGGDVEEGFIEVTKDTKYSKKRSFGWTSGEMGEYGGYGLIDVVTGNSTDGKPPFKFRVDCPIGKYRIFIVGGVIEWTHADIFVKGIKKATLRTFRERPHIRSATFEVDTQEPYIEVEIRSELGWRLSGLVIYPVSEKNSIESAMLVVFHNLEIVSRDLVKKNKVKFLVPEDANSLPRLDDASKKRGYFVTTVPIESLLPPTIKPKQEQLCHSPLKMEIARNEKQTMRIRLWALKDLWDVRIDSGKTLQNQDAKTLLSDAIEVTRLDYQWRRQLVLDNKGYQRYDTEPNFVQYPTKMERQGTHPWGADGSGALNMVPFHVKADCAQEFCITVNVPQDAKAGLYAGTILIQANDLMEEIPLHLRVLPFALVDDTGSLEYRFFSHLLTVNGLLSSNSVVAKVAEDYLRKELRFMKDWGATQWSTWYTYYVENRDNPEQSIDPLFLKFMKIAGEEDMLRGKYYYMWWVTWTEIFKKTMGIAMTDWYSNPEPYFDLGTNPEYEKFRNTATAEVKMIKREFLKRGWPEPLFGPMDEPSRKVAPILTALSHIIHEGGGKTSTQTPDNDTDIKWLDIVDYPVSYQEWFNLSCSRELHNIGRPNQVFRPCWGHLRISGLSRGEAGLFGLYSEVDNIQYAFWWSPRGNPESEIDHFWSREFPVEMTACYQRDYGPASSLHTEVLRTGRDDARYALTLQELIDRGMNDFEKARIARGIKRDYEKMMSSFVDSAGSCFNFKPGDIDWDANREQLKKWILELW
jgi:hypothetical protein